MDRTGYTSTVFRASMAFWAITLFHILAGSMTTVSTGTSFKYGGFWWRSLSTSFQNCCGLLGCRVCLGRNRCSWHNGAEGNKSRGQNRTIPPACSSAVDIVHFLLLGFILFVPSNRYYSALVFTIRNTAWQKIIGLFVSERLPCLACEVFAQPVTQLSISCYRLSKKMHATNQLFVSSSMPVGLATVWVGVAVVMER